MGHTGTATERPELGDRPAPLHGALRLTTYCDGEGAWSPGCGSCGGCGGRVPKAARPQEQKRWFCRTECRRWWLINHQWKEARRACVKRDRETCTRCHRRATTSASRRRPGRIEPAGLPNVALEVNHKTPLDGRADGYTTGCQHHLDGLETVCTDCHAEITTGQGRERRDRAELAAPARRVRPERPGIGGLV